MIRLREWRRRRRLLKDQGLVEFPTEADQLAERAMGQLDGTLEERKAVEDEAERNG